MTVIQREYRALVLACLAAGVLAASGVALAVDLEEGGYVGSKTDGADETVYNFIGHFSWEEYFWATRPMFTTSNDTRVDAMDFAYFCGHGDRWSIQMSDGAVVNLGSAGYSSHAGYGRDLEFIVYHACKVIPSPRETSAWSQPWVTEPDDTFDGLHQALGFRSNASTGTDQNISNYFGSRIHDNAKVWQSWFDAIDRYGRSDEFGSAVMWPAAENDTYGSVCADPPASHTSLRIWYQY